MQIFLYADAQRLLFLFALFLLDINYGLKKLRRSGFFLHLNSIAL